MSQYEAHPNQNILSYNYNDVLIYTSSYLRTTLSTSVLLTIIRPGCTIFNWLYNNYRSSFDADRHWLGSTSRTRATCSRNKPNVGVTMQRWWIKVFFSLLFSVYPLIVLSLKMCENPEKFGSPIFRWLDRKYLQNFRLLGLSSWILDSWENWDSRECCNNIDNFFSLKFSVSKIISFWF